MTGSARLKPIMTLVAALLIVGLVTFVFFRANPDEPLNPRDQQTEALTGQEDPSQEPAEAGLTEPGKMAWRRLEKTRADDAGAEKPAKTGLTIPPGVSMDEYKAELWTQIRADPPDLEREKDSVIDAELAYRLYLYYGNCSITARQANQVDKQLDRIVSRAERAKERYLDRLEGRANQILDYYELCLPIPPEVDRRLEAVYWMSKAVQLGHDIAEVQYYEKAMGFILRSDRYSSSPPLAMQYPELVSEFKSTAKLGLARALDKGRPEAYLAKSQAVLEGLIYPKDAFLAYAYARAAEVEAARNHIILNNSSERKREAAQYLSQEQIREAEQLALELPLQREG